MATQAEPTDRSRTWTLVTLAFGYFIDQGEGQALSVLFPTIRALRGLDYTALGMIGTVRNILQLIGAPIWGFAADRLSRKQVSIFSGIPLTYILFAMTDNWTFGAVFALCFLTALLISWPGKGAKEPMMLGVVAPELRATAFAMTTFIESGFAAVAAFIAGSLADRIGFTRAMLWTIPFPWLICGILYSGFSFVYPGDAVKLRAEMARRAATMS